MKGKAVVRVGIAAAVIIAVAIGCATPEPSVDPQVQAFVEAAREGDTDSVERMADNVDIDGFGSGGETALMAAAFNAHYDTVVFLVEAGADVHKRDRSNGWRAVEFAKVSILPREDLPRVIEYLERQMDEAE